MSNKQSAFERARRLPLPTPGGQVKASVAVALAWMKLHGLKPARTQLGKPRWEHGMLVVTFDEPPVVDSEFDRQAPDP